MKLALKSYLLLQLITDLGNALYGEFTERGAVFSHEHSLFSYFMLF